MMKLYYATATCSTACHIACEEVGAQYAPVEVSWGKNLNVKELDELNPLGAVPVLMLGAGKVLTQNTAILEYLADTHPQAGLLAAPGTWERSETMSWVSFVAADLQKAFSPFFQADQITQSSEARTEIKKYAVERVQALLSHIDLSLSGKSFIAGGRFTIADIYLFTIVGWAKWYEIDTKSYQNINPYMKRIFDRPAVQRVLEKEDLLDYLQE